MRLDSFILYILASEILQGISGKLLRTLLLMLTLLQDRPAVDKNMVDDPDLEDGVQEPALQLAIKTKWDDADIDWHGVHPYV